MRFRGRCSSVEDEYAFLDCLDDDDAESRLGFRSSSGVEIVSFSELEGTERVEWLKEGERDVLGEGIADVGECETGG